MSSTSFAGTRRATLVATLLGVLVALPSCQVTLPDQTGGTHPSGTPDDVHGPYEVVRVVDGDTLSVRRGGSELTLRLMGMDTPETKDPRKPVQCFGREASARAHRLLDGARVFLEYDDSQGSRDKYGRTLAYVWVGSGPSTGAHGSVLYNRVMIRDGYAHEYTYDLPYAYQDDFKDAERSARTAGRGLWSPSTCGGDTLQAAQDGGGSRSVRSAGPRPTRPSRGDGGADPRFGSCREATAHGHGPYRRGSDPEYGWYRDGDGDGAVCE